MRFKVGDHGMTSTFPHDASKVIIIDDILDLEEAKVIDYWPNLMVLPKDMDDGVY